MATVQGWEEGIQDCSGERIFRGHVAYTAQRVRLIGMDVACSGVKKTVVHTGTPLSSGMSVCTPQKGRPKDVKGVIFLLIDWSIYFNFISLPPANTSLLD